MNPRHEHNHDRGYERYDKVVSDLLRTVPRTRHLDVDFYQYCEICKEPLWFAETERYRNLDDLKHKSSYMTLRLARRCRVPMVLIQHDNVRFKLSFWDIDNPQPYVVEGDKSLVIRFCEKMRDRHTCEIAV